ncbi:uncharacterized protein VTP21DRAFT_2664 [Calcarisporiella thermophila]|uniref:uncharacterized protein n=1 Tax=Calcarisporiella thermophila TaxID=911321 RepID=UPI003743A675
MGHPIALERQAFAVGGFLGDLAKPSKSQWPFAGEGAALVSLNFWPHTSKENRVAIFFPSFLITGSATSLEDSSPEALVLKPSCFVVLWKLGDALIPAICDLQNSLYFLFPNHLIYTPSLFISHFPLSLPPSSASLIH